MKSKNEYLDGVGIFSGVYFSFIPLFWFYQYFKSFNALKKTRLFVFATILAIFSGVAISILIMIVVAFVTNNLVFAEKIEPIWTVLVFPTWIMHILYGIYTSRELKRDNHILDSERFNIAKLAGASMALIPYYFLIKVITTGRIIDKLLSDGTSIVATSVIALILNGTIIFAIFGLGILYVNAKKLNKLYDIIIEFDTY